MTRQYPDSWARLLSPWHSIRLAAIFWLMVAMSVAVTATADEVPSYLARHKEIYRQDPHAAAVAWFRDAKFGLFVHYAAASVLEGGKPEYLKLTAGLKEQVELSKRRSTLSLIRTRHGPVFQPLCLAGSTFVSQISTFMSQTTHGGRH